METWVYIFVTFFLFSDAYRSPIRVFEILKTWNQDPRVDVQNHDSELTKQDRNNNNNRNLKHYMKSMNMKALYNMKSHSNEDSEDNDEDSIFVDKTRNLPVLILPNDQTVYREKPGNYKFLHQLLHSALRTNDVEDRTAPPRHRGNYEYDNY